MELESFFPYRLALLADAVSRSMAQVYAERFDLSRDEWRVLAALSQESPIRTAQVIERTTLDKVSVGTVRCSACRARTWSNARPTPPMRVGHVIRLRPAGRALLRRIVPMVQAREQYLLDALDPAERAALDGALDKVLARARQLALQG